MIITPATTCAKAATNSQITQSMLPGQFPYQRPLSSTTSTIEGEGETKGDSGFPVYTVD